MARIFRRRGPDGRWLKTYYAWVPDPETGGTRRISTRCTDATAARKRADELEREALDPDSAAQAKAQLRDAFDLLIMDRESMVLGGKRSQETVEFYRKEAGILLGAVPELLGLREGAPVPLREVRGPLVDDYIVMRRKDGVEESTIQKELTAWRAAMRLAKRRRIWKGDLEETFPKFSAEYEPREWFLHVDDVLRLRAAFIRPRKFRGGHESDDEQGHALWAVAAFMVATSAEWAAVWRARREDIIQTDPNVWLVHVRGTKRKTRDRWVPVVHLPFAFLLDEALRFADGVHGLFLDRRSSFRNRLRDASIRAGLAVRGPDGEWVRPPLCPNDLRRTHGKWLRLAGVHTSTIFPSLGHADSRMAERVYAKSSAAELAHVQRAELAAASGIHMGSDPGETGQNRALLPKPEPEKEP